MKWPPMLMHVKIKNHDTNFGIWLPLFLLFPLTLVLLIAFSPLILVALLVLWCCGWGNWVRMAWHTGKMAFISLWEMKGLKVDIQGRDGVVDISVV
jgi:hypothetical protein